MKTVSKDNVGFSGYSKRGRSKACGNQINLPSGGDGIRVEKSRDGGKREEEERDINGRMATRPTESGESIFASR